MKIYTAQGIRTTCNLTPHEFTDYVAMLNFLNQRFPGVEKDEQTYVVLCDLKDGHRDQASARDYYGLMVDYDGEERLPNPKHAEYLRLSKEERRAVVVKPKAMVPVVLPYADTPTPLIAHEHLIRMGISHLIYPSFSHIPGIKNKFRIVIPFASPLPASNLPQAVRHVVAACAIPGEWVRGMDLKAMTARSQGFYLYSGNGPAGELPTHIYTDGRPVTLPPSWPQLDPDPGIPNFDRSSLAKIAGEGLNPIVLTLESARRGLEILGLGVGPLVAHRDGGYRVRCSCPDADLHGSTRDKEATDTECFLRVGEVPRLYCHHTGCSPSFHRMIEDAPESVIRRLRDEGCFAAYIPDLSTVGRRPGMEVLRNLLLMGRGLGHADLVMYLDDVRSATQYPAQVIRSVNASIMGEDDSIDTRACAKMKELLQVSSGRFRTLAGNSQIPSAQMFNGRFWQFLPLNTLERMAQEVLVSLSPVKDNRELIARRTALVKRVLLDVCELPPDLEALADTEDECLVIARNCEIILSAANGGRPVCRDFTPATNATSGIDVDFIPGATCPRFLKIIRESFPDPDMQLLVQQVFGAAVSGYRPAGLRGCAIVKGSMTGFDGKNSLFGGVLVKLLGPGTVHSNPDLHGLMHDDRRAYALVGKQMLLIDDRERGEAMYMSDIKNIGETKSRATRRLYMDTVDNLISVMPISLSNGWPIIRGVDAAGVSRILAIPMDRSHAKERSEGMPNPWEDVSRYELPGVLNWAIEGLQSLVEANGFAVNTPAHRQAREECLLWACPEYNFVRTRCEIGPSRRTYLRDFMSAYADFLKDTRFGREDRASASDAIGVFSLVPGVTYDPMDHIVRGVVPKSVLESNSELPPEK